MPSSVTPSRTSRTVTTLPLAGENLDTSGASELSQALDGIVADVVAAFCRDDRALGVRVVPCPTPARPPSREGGGAFSPYWLSNSFSSCKVGVDLGHSGCESDDSGAENGGDGHGVVASPGATARTAVIADCRSVSSTGIRWLRRGGPVGRAAAVPTGARPDRKGMPQVTNPGPDHAGPQPDGGCQLGERGPHPSNNSTGRSWCRGRTSSRWVRDAPRPGARHTAECIGGERVHRQQPLQVQLSPAGR